MPSTTAALKPPPTPTARLSTILGATLESCAHELLFVRRVYPRESFAPHRVFGVTCHANRHSGVVDYVYDFLSVAVPALLAGTADEVALVVTEHSSPGEPERILERFVFGFDTAGMEEAMRLIEASDEDDGEAVGRAVRYLEPRLRDVLLQIVSMDGLDLNRRRRRGGTAATASVNTTFKLCLRAARSRSDDGGGNQDDSQEAPSLPPCAELESAIKGGKWFRPEPTSCAFGGGGRPGRIPEETTRTLKSVDAPACGLRMDLKMELNPE